jgi:hypothetical protein
MSEPLIPDTKTAMDSDDAFLRQVRQDLDHSCAALDGQTLSRLNRIRHTALERKAVRRRSPFLLPFGGLVTASVLVFSVMLSDRTQDPVETAPAAAAEQLEDMELLSASEGLDFYEELEFYQWLANSSN